MCSEDNIEKSWDLLLEIVEAKKVDGEELWDEVKRLRRRIAAVVRHLRHDSKWDQPEPEGYGDGETWAHYQFAMHARTLLAILEGDAETLAEDQARKEKQ